MTNTGSNSILATKSGSNQIQAITDPIVGATLIKLKEIGHFKLYETGATGDDQATQNLLSHL